MLLDISGINALAIWTDAVQVLVDVGDTVLPNFILPFRRWELVFHWRLRSSSAAAYSIQGCRLTSLLFHIHLREQMFDAPIDRPFRILANIHPYVLVQIDPAIATALVSIVGLILHRLKGRLY